MAESRLMRDASVMHGLMDARRCLQSLHGDRYAERMRLWVELVQAAARQEQKPVLSAVLVLCGKTTNEIDHLWLMAAGVEALVSEPVIPVGTDGGAAGVSECCTETTGRPRRSR